MEMLIDLLEIREIQYKTELGRVVAVYSCETHHGLLSTWAQFIGWPQKNKTNSLESCNKLMSQQKMSQFMKKIDEES